MSPGEPWLYTRQGLCVSLLLTPLAGTASLPLYTQGTRGRADMVPPKRGVAGMRTQISLLYSCVHLGEDIHMALGFLQKEAVRGRVHPQSPGLTLIGHSTSLLDSGNTGVLAVSHKREGRRL